MEMMKEGMTCKCSHHKVGPVLIVLFGLTFLLGAFNVITASAVNVIWPIIVTVGGLMKLGAGRCKCC